MATLAIPIQNNILNQQQNNNSSNGNNNNNNNGQQQNLNSSNNGNNNSNGQQPSLSSSGQNHNNIYGFYRGSDTQSSNSLYSRDDDDDDSQYFDAIDYTHWNISSSNNSLLATTPPSPRGGEFLNRYLTVPNNHHHNYSNNNQIHLSVTPPSPPTTQSTSNSNSPTTTSVSSTTELTPLSTTPLPSPPPPPSTINKLSTNEMPIDGDTSRSPVVITSTTHTISNPSLYQWKNDRSLPTINEVIYVTSTSPPQSSSTTSSSSSPSLSSPPSTSLPNVKPLDPSQSVVTSPPSSISPNSTSPPLNSNNPQNKAKRNSRVFNIIKTKKEGFQNLLKDIGIMDNNNNNQNNQNNSKLSSSPPLQSNILDYDTNSNSSGSSNGSEYYNNNQNNVIQQHPPQESKFKKLIKNIIDSKDDNNCNNMGSQNITLSNNNLTIGNDNPHRVTRWLKSIGNNSSSNHPNSSIKKKTKELNSTFGMIQNIQAHTGSIWVSELSPDGSYLSTGGFDSIIKIWKLTNELDGSNNGGIVTTTNTIELKGHSGHILDIKWINNLLLSCSTDKTVKLWDVLNGECLKTYEHNDIVVSLSLDNISHTFYTSTLDGIVRKYSLATHELLHQIEIGEFVTTITLSQQPNYLIVTTHLGNVHIYNPNSFELVTKFNVSNNHHAKKGKGPKIVGVLTSSTSNQNDNNNILSISTNDSSIRQYSLIDFKRICKYQGMVLENHQIKPSISYDKRILMIGSEDNNIYLWYNYTFEDDNNTNNNGSRTKNHHNHHSKLTIDSCEYINGLQKPITTTLFYPNNNNNQNKHQQQQHHYIIATDTAGHLLVYGYK